MVPSRVCEPHGDGSRRSAADSYSGPNCPAALCGGSKPEDDKLALSWWEGRGRGERLPGTRWGVGLRSDCPQCVLHCVKTLKHTPYALEQLYMHVQVCRYIHIHTGACTINSDNPSLGWFSESP